MEFLFVIGFVIVFIFISWFLFTLANGDILIILKWAKWICILVTSISFIVWAIESMKTSKWFDIRNITTIPLLINLFYGILLIICRVVIIKMKNRKSRGTMMYGITYNNPSIESSNNYVHQRAMMMLVILIVVNPILNIYFWVDFIKLYF
ncbi:hypothetical protein Cpap_1281 [Ruminiclostridium papyrosolvens DSM 2782]|uniref:Uncharacterized protein n=1 Tax=Ruminiclostridium papyrosolvens DSM 2782 TaxID=588581 RepID=F1TFL0_9FIRM|nr:hypothetical protein Cpap_1281 [Ruminiclostridium papyrosolvens DSM 2782]